jgi:hypothetical protein
MIAAAFLSSREQAVLDLCMPANVQDRPLHQSATCCELHQRLQSEPDQQELAGINFSVHMHSLRVAYSTVKLCVLLVWLACKGLHSVFGFTVWNFALRALVCASHMELTAQCIELKLTTSPLLALCW